MNENILETIGSPLVEIDAPAGATVAAKVESFNPGGSAKDRPALRMIEAAERDGELEPGDRLVEPSSGNTGIGIALVGAAKGYDVTIVMPEDMSVERRRLMAAYGADLELVAGDMSDARERADELEREEGMIQVRQFENPANPRAHYETTGVELIEQVGDRTVDAFVAGIGTGGTVSGTGRRLREAFPEVDIVGVEPADNAVLTTGEAGSDGFQGMGPGFVSDNLDRDVLDEVRTVDLDDAESACRRLSREEGLLVGQSSGAMAVIAREVARERAEPDATEEPLVVTVFWDSGERYLSTGLFD